MGAADQAWQPQLWLEEPEPTRDKGKGARRAESLGHVLEWAWNPNVPAYRMWTCTLCGRDAGDRRPEYPAPGWDGVVGGATVLPRCQGKPKKDVENRGPT